MIHVLRPKFIWNCQSSLNEDNRKMESGEKSADVNKKKSRQSLTGRLHGSACCPLTL